MLMELPKTPIVDIQTTNNRGFTPEEVATRCVDKIVEVGITLPLKYGIKRERLNNISIK